MLHAGARPQGVAAVPVPEVPGGRTGVEQHPGRPEPAIGPVRLDPSQLDQIMTNLCLNARDAITGVGKVTIETANTRFDEEYCALHHVSVVFGKSRFPSFDESVLRAQGKRYLMANVPRDRLDDGFVFGGHEYRLPGREAPALRIRESEGETAGHTDPCREIGRIFRASTTVTSPR